jgi:hypothetical protein
LRIGYPQRGAIVVNAIRCSLCGCQKLSLDEVSLTSLAVYSITKQTYICFYLNCRTVIVHILDISKLLLKSSGEKICDGSLLKVYRYKQYFLVIFTHQRYSWPHQQDVPQSFLQKALSFVPPLGHQDHDLKS